MQSDMLLEHQGIRELLVAHGALVQNAHRWFRTVHSHVCLEIALRSERPPTDLTLERPLACVRTVMHLQSALTRQNPMTDHALIWVCQFVFDVVHQLLQL